MTIGAYVSRASIGLRRRAVVGGPAGGLVSTYSSTLPLLRPVSAALNSFVGIIGLVRTGTQDPFVGFKNSCRIDSLCYSQVVHVLVVAGPRELTWL
jgi:hypothetical protein